MRTRRRRTVVAHPAIHCDEQRALSPRVFVAVRLLLARPLRRQVTAWNMLRAGDEIDADVVRHFRVVAIERRVDERRSASTAPIFAGRIGIEDLRPLVRSEFHQYPVSLAAHRIVLIEIEVGKQRRHEKAETIRPRKARIEVGAARGACDVRDHAIESAAILFVGVEALVEKFAQEAAVLRGTKSINVTRCDRTALSVFDRGCHVAQRRKSEARNDGALGLVAQLIEMAWLVAALEIERGNIEHQLPVLQAAELPLVARNRARRAEKAIA